INDIQTALFQSSPNLSVGCYPWCFRECDKTTKPVSILTQPLGWVLQGRDMNNMSHMRVSILTQPLGWVLLKALDAQGLTLAFQSSPNLSVGCYAAYFSIGSVLFLFQSSPNLSVGCYRTAAARTPPSRSFNPHPTSRLGATQ